jgi:alginate O-acetyltransferase complex protein AlgI
LAAYTLQIFFDFSGYTDMAIGLGQMIGLHLPENFNYPYLAQSISDFWRRWHITLTIWFREYVFYPLERRRFKWAGQQFNILIVFLLTGLWHGFKPTSIVWGLLHGIATALESTGFGRQLKKLWRPLRHLYTLLIIVIGWVFFRSDNLDFAFGFFQRLAGNTDGLVPLPFSQTTPLPFIEPSFILGFV